MELRVWVDGTQRVVCGVNIATTCQEIVFALAHATQQAGRFTMIEKWRNNERLLSPNEQPLVTLQRWGEHMNEVEFILRKTSESTNLQQSNQQVGGSTTSTNESIDTLSRNQQSQPPQFQPVHQQHHHQLPHQQQQPQQHEQQQQQQHQHHNSHQPVSQGNNQLHKWFPANGLVRPRQPPGYKDYMNVITRNSMPRSVSSNANFLQGNIYQHNQQFENPNQQPNQRFYHSPQQNGTNPVQKFLPNEGYRYSINGPPTNNYDIGARDNSSSSIEATVENVQTNNRSMPNISDLSPYVTGKSQSAIPTFNNHTPTQGPPQPPAPQGSTPRISTQLVTTQPHATKNQIILNTRPTTPPLSNTADKTNTPNNKDSNCSIVSQIGHDMLKVIEEQKRVLIDQKNKINKLDQDGECWLTKQNSEQKVLMNKIESEINDLEELRKDNQSQIEKLENQNLEKELELLKLEQEQLETEVERQKSKLSKCENDIASCKAKMQQLEKEVTAHMSPKNRKVINELIT